MKPYLFESKQNSEPAKRAPNSDLTQIKSNLNDTTTTLNRSISRLLMRGNQVEDISVLSEALMESSEEFLIKVSPWYVRVWQSCPCPSWWCERKEDEEEAQYGVQRVRRGVEV